MIDININVGLTDQTLSGLKDIASLISAGIICHTKPDAVQSLCDDLRNGPEQEVKTTTVAPEKITPVEPVEVMDPTTLYQSIRRAQIERKVDPMKIKAVYAEFGIANSKECPAERRKELYDKVEAL